MFVVCSLETRTLESLPALKSGLSASLKVAGSSESLLPLTTHPLNLGLFEEGGQLSRPHLLKEDEWKESNGRVCTDFPLLINTFWWYP